MVDIRMRDRSPKPRTFEEIVREDSFAGWLMILAGAILIGASYLMAARIDGPTPLAGLLFVAAGVTLNRFFKPKRGMRGSRSRRAVRRFVAMLLVAIAILMLWFPVLGGWWRSLFA